MHEFKEVGEMEKEKRYVGADCCTLFWIFKDFHQFLHNKVKNVNAV